MLELLSDRASNPDYDIVLHFFRTYRETALGSRNGKSMFERLRSIVKEYNNSGQGKAALQEFDANTGKLLILCVVMGLICRVHEKIPQAHELCYMDALASFKHLNMSITLLYTSCAVGALPLGLFTLHLITYPFSIETYHRNPSFVHISRFTSILEVVSRC